MESRRAVVACAGRRAVDRPRPRRRLRAYDQCRRLGMADRRDRGRGSLPILLGQASRRGRNDLGEDSSMSSRHKTDRRSLLAAAPAAIALAAAAPGSVARAAPSAGLTTHMLDTVNGKPAAGVRIDFAVLEGDHYKP